MASTFDKLPKKMVLQKLKNKDYSNSQERTLLLQTLTKFNDLKITDVAWMLFIPDAMIRKTGEDVIKQLKDPNSLPILIREMKGKPSGAKKNFLSNLPSLQLPDFASRLTELIEDKDKEIQEVGYRLLLEMPLDRQNFATFKRLAEQGNIDLRMRALERLKESGGPAVLRLMSQLVDDPNEKIRSKAYECLLETKDTKYLKLFLERIVVESPSMKELLSKGIAGFSDQLNERVLDDVLSLLSSGNNVLRKTVLDILIKMPNRKQVIRHFIEYSRTLLGWVRSRALESMREFGEDLIEPIIELMGDNDPEIRATALLVSGSFKDKRIVPRACKLLNDPDWWIRIGAAEILGNIGDASAVPHLIKALEDHEVRWSAIEALGKLKDPRALQTIISLTQDPEPEIRVEAIQALVHFPGQKAIDVLFKIVQADPVKAIKMRAYELMQSIAQEHNINLPNAKNIQAAISSTSRSQGEPKLHFYLIAARQKDASDFHLSVGTAPLMRIDGKLIKVKGEPLTDAHTVGLINEILEPDQRKILKDKKQLDFCYYVPNVGRYRANVFLDHKGYNAVFRVIPEAPPTLAEIGLPGHLARITHYHQGLIIICGPAGSGKTTTLAALVNLINDSKRDHILTLEDPIEFIHPFKNCLINQREVGKHTKTFAASLRAALREDPDVIVLGEMRDNETTSLAMTAAETGHVVFCTMNTTTAHKAIDRIITAYPVDEQPQVRMALSETLKAVVAQFLLPKPAGRGRTAVFEVLLGTSALANLIRDDKTYQIPSLMQISKHLGMQTFDHALMELVKESRVSPEVAYMRAFKKDEFETLVSKEFLEGLLV